MVAVKAKMLNADLEKVLDVPRILILTSERSSIILINIVTKDNDVNPQTTINQHIKYKSET